VNFPLLWDITGKIIFASWSLLLYHKKSSGIDLFELFLLQVFIKHSFVGSLFSQKVLFSFAINIFQLPLCEAIMILSFHPCFESDKNIICAGRNPGADDLAAIKSAYAVILPQGCGEYLYHMAVENCPNVFPDFDVKFKYPGKNGQIRLFEKEAVLFPKTSFFSSTAAFDREHGENWDFFPFVFKFNWGGEGDNVYFLDSFSGLREILQKAVKYEKTGQKGFLIQEFIPSGGRSLRVVAIGGEFFSYWRVLPDKTGMCAGLGKGAVIDYDSDMDLQKIAISAAIKFCIKTGINLAGFDFLFPSGCGKKEPFFLEINYFFGRKGIGGSEKFYKILVNQILLWLSSL